MKITPITPIGIDERGYTAEYYHERLGQHLIIFRKAGSVSGRHYHKGISLTKDPEIFIILHGECTVNWREPNSQELHTAHVKGPVKLEIPPYTWHEVIMLTGSICLELNSIADHKADTFYDL